MLGSSDIPNSTRKTLRFTHYNPLMNEWPQIVSLSLEYIAQTQVTSISIAARIRPQQNSNATNDKTGIRGLQGENRHGMSLNINQPARPIYVLQREISIDIFSMAMTRCAQWVRPNEKEDAGSNLLLFRNSRTPTSPVKGRVRVQIHIEVPC